MEVQSTKPDWWEKAACKGLDTSLFVYPTAPRNPAAEARVDAAVSVCETCPVKKHCAQDEVQVREENRAPWPYQVRAGLRLWTDEADQLPDVVQYYKYEPPPRPAHRPWSNPYERRHWSEAFKDIDLDWRH